MGVSWRAVCTTVVLEGFLEEVLVQNSRMTLLPGNTSLFSALLLEWLSVAQSHWVPGLGEVALWFSLQRN